MEASSSLRPGVTVLGNLAVDRIDGAPPTPGGAPTFAGLALAPFGNGRIVARGAAADLPLFDDLVTGSGVPFDVISADATAGFGLNYDGDDRTMTVDALGPVWGRTEIARARVDTAWVHLAPLLRSDFPPEALAALAAQGHRIGYDGQGLVRVPETGALRTDADFDPALLTSVSVLKLADDEASVVAEGDTFSAADARRLGVPEILVTAGSKGSELFLNGRGHRVAPAWQVDRVHTTGAGDLFTISYVAARARGDAPLAAAAVASQLVAEILQVRLEASGG